MVHLLADRLRDEFLAVPSLVRLDMPYGANGPEPTLLIKANSLALKYLLRQRSFRFMISQIGFQIVYAVEIPDDPDRPAAVWSLLGASTEVVALRELIANPRCVVFLFNELAVSVAWTELEVRIEPWWEEILGVVELHTNASDQDEEIVGARLDQMRVQEYVPRTQILVFDMVEWHELNVIYITNQLGSSTLSLFNKDEGGQQEELAVWLTDSLHPSGCVKGAQVIEKKSRELSDVLLSYDNGAFLIESKSLSVLARDKVPNQKKLSADISKHISKAARQLSGGIQNLKNGLVVTDKVGKVLDVERKKPVHAIILVPDLALLEDATEFGPGFIFNFMEATGGFLHILDTTELLRIVQAAEMIAKDSVNLTKMMAFDWYLMKRVERARNHLTPHFGVLFRREAPGNGDRINPA